MWRIKNREGKGGKYLRKENIFFAEEKGKEENIWRRKYIVCRGEEKQRGRKSFGEGKCHNGGHTDRRLSRQKYIVKIEL